MILHSHLMNICKLGQGAECCKYLGSGEEGFECMKADPARKATVDVAWAHTRHVAQGDNCPGVPKVTDELK